MKSGSASAICRSATATRAPEQLYPFISHSLLSLSARHTPRTHGQEMVQGTLRWRREGTAADYALVDEVRAVVAGGRGVAKDSRAASKSFTIF